MKKILIILILASTQVMGQYKKQKNNTAGIVGLSALPISFITTELNHFNFVYKFGNTEPYMKGNKLYAYNNMMNNNNSILVTGAIVTVTSLVIQHFVSKKTIKKKCYFQ